MYTSKYEIRYSDYKDFDTVKPSTALEVIQELAIQDAASCGHDIALLREMGVAWLLKGFNVHFEKPLSTHAPLEAFTAVKNMKASTSERGCIIKQNGEIVVKSIANWFLFDAKKQRPSRIPPAMAAVYELYDFDDDFFSYKKPETFEIAAPEYTVRVSNKDIDTNRHLNNEKGAELLMDAIPFDFFFSDMSIIYKKQAYLGETLGVCVKELPSGYYVHLQNASGEICVAATFESR